MITAVRRFLGAYGIGPCPIVAAVSGGVDSTALLLAMAELREDGYAIRAGHVNHHLRGEESDEDEQFVRSLCRRLDLPLDVTDGALDPERIRESGLEAAARDVRHERLAAIAAAAGARYVATAHQTNDQAETVLMRLMTGTGLAGLRGIHPRRDDGWIRPLLDVTRAQIEEFLAERGVTPRVDRMNADPRFLRSRVRQILKELDPSVVTNLAATAQQAQQVWPMVEKALDAVERSCTLTTETETRFLRWPDDTWLRQAGDVSLETLGQTLTRRTSVSPGKPAAVDPALPRSGKTSEVPTPPADTQLSTGTNPQDVTVAVLAASFELKTARSLGIPDSKLPTFPLAPDALQAQALPSLMKKVVAEGFTATDVTELPPYMGGGVTRIAEDALRMVRAVRFATRFGLRLDDATILSGSEGAR